MITLCSNNNTMKMSYGNNNATTPAVPAPHLLSVDVSNLLTVQVRKHFSHNLLVRFHAPTTPRVVRSRETGCGKGVVSLWNACTRYRVGRSWLTLQTARECTMKWLNLAREINTGASPVDPQSLLRQVEEVAVATQELRSPHTRGET